MKTETETMEISRMILKRNQAQRIENYKRLNKIASKNQILFTGSSLMEQFPIHELAAIYKFKKIIFNRGVSGFTTDDFIENIDCMLFDLEPSTVFINIGTNDMKFYDNENSWEDHLEKNYDYILAQCKQRLPNTKVFVMAYYPMAKESEETRSYLALRGSLRSNRKLKCANAIAEALANKYNYKYIDVNDGLTDENGNLKEAFCKDPIHMYADAYDIVFRNLLKYLAE